MFKWLNNHFDCRNIEQTVHVIVHFMGRLEFYRHTSVFLQLRLRLFSHYSLKFLLHSLYIITYF